MNNTDRKICCFTGHREIEQTSKEALPQALFDVIRELYKEGFRIFRAGGAMGFDMIASLSVLEMKKELDIELELFLPCRNQNRGWPAREISFYNYVLEHCDRYRYTGEFYTNGCMLERNRRMLEGSHICVAYCTHSRGGTAYTVTRAYQSGIRVINLADRI